MLIRLSRRELSVCRQVARFRWQLARHSRTADLQQDENQFGHDIDYIGCKGEMAVCKVFGLEFNTDPVGIDSGEDLWLDDISVDVKTSSTAGAEPVVRGDKRILADYAVFAAVTGCDDMMEVMGYSDPDMFDAMKQQATRGTGRGVILPRKDMLPIRDLWQVWRESALGGKGTAVMDPFP